MQCERAQDSFSALLDGGISEPLKIAVENHISECTQCRHAFNDFKKIWSALSIEEDVELPLDLHDKITSRIDAYEWSARNMQPTGWKAFVGRSLAYVGAVAIVVLIYFGALYIQPDRGKTVIGNLLSIPSQQQPAKLTNMPVLTAEVSVESPVMELLYKAEKETRYEMHLTHVVGEFNSLNNVMMLSGTLAPRQDFSLALTGQMSEQQPTLVWFARHEGEISTATLFILPSIGNNVANIGAVTTGNFIEEMVVIAERYKIPIAIDGISTAPKITVDATSIKADEALRLALAGTHYQLTGIVNGVAIVKATSR